MAKLLPHFDPSAIDQPGERCVAESLCAQLPPEVVIFHSYPWLRPERHERTGKETLQEGEADFVIVHPRFGYLVVEVKGGHVYFDQRTTRWERRGARHQMKDPFAQAAKNMHVIEDLAQSRYFKHDLPFVRGYCVVFPDCEWTGTTPPGAVNQNLFAASDLGRLGTRIETLFRSFDRRTDHKPLPASVLDGIVRTLTSEFKLTPALWREIEDQERIIFRYTEDQIMVLDLLAQHKRAAIQGVAGSGKTQLALAKARAFAEQGQRVLLLCYNKLLAQWLAQQVSDLDGRITAVNYHRMAHEWCSRAKVPFPASSDDSAFWLGEAARCFETALDVLPDDRFDAVVVDEGQDFHESWWDSIELLKRDFAGGALYVFYDPAQQLQHMEDQRLPHLGTPFSLPCNCRNTQRISALCAASIKREIRVKAGTPEGKTPDIRLAIDEEAQRKEITGCLKSWLQGSGGLSKRQVAILCPVSVSHSSLRQTASLAGFPVTDDLSEWRAGKAVLLTTIRRFKGLESDAVILFDVPDISDEAAEFAFTCRHLYVACSRAKHLLCVVTTSKALESELNH